MPEAAVSPAAGVPYGEKAGVPVMDFSYVGIDAILEQMRRKAMKQGFELNIMVVGKQDARVSVCVTSLSTVNVCLASKHAVSRYQASPVVLVFSLTQF